MEYQICKHDSGIDFVKRDIVGIETLPVIYQILLGFAYACGKVVRISPFNGHIIPDIVG